MGPLNRSASEQSRVGSDRAGAWSSGQKANGKGLMLTAFRPARTILAHGKRRNPFRSK
jgi:hypothetical protein